jgi:hypothetical protein
MATPFFWDAYIRHTTNPGRRVSGSIYVLYDENAIGRRGIDVRPQITLRPGPAWNLSGELIYAANTQPRQYATELAGGRDETYGRRYVFASLRRRELSARVRFNYALSPDITIETYLEPFASTGDYDAFGELDRPRSHDLRYYGAGGTLNLLDDGRRMVTDAFGAFTLPNLDFSVRSIRSNAVLRWEWRRGSTFFLVWQQDRATRLPSADAAGPAALWSAFRAPGSHRLLAKVSYWMSP